MIARPHLVAALASLCALTACTPAAGGGGEFAELSASLEQLPGIAPRLSIGSAYRPCNELAPPDGTIVRADCPVRKPRRRDHSSSVARRAAGRSDPHSALTLAILDLHARDTRGKALDRSISSLRRLATLIDQPAPVLADLAAALIVRAERTQAPRDLLEAYEITGQALEREPHNLAALYNRALALDRYGLVDQVAADWSAYLAADPGSAWAADARRRLNDLRHLPSLPPPPAADAPPAAYAYYAAADPQRARELGMDRLLGEWGTAVEAGDSARAFDRLNRAAALGAALERRSDGDASLADAVRAIRDARKDPARLRSLARAHREYAAGMVLYDSAEYRRAEPRFAAVVAAPGASFVLRDWARAFYGTMRVFNGAAADGTRILRETIGEVDAGRYPALAARARWSYGNTMARGGAEWEGALREARRSAALFASADERENEGGALNIVTDAHFVLGEPDSAYAVMHRAFGRLRPYNASVRLHTLLTAGARHLEADGLIRAAIALQVEDVRVAARGGRTIHLIEARAARARLLAARGDGERALADLGPARALLPRITDEGARGWLQADLREVEARALLHENPRRAAPAFDSAAAFFAKIPIRSLPPRVGGAEARLAVGDAAGATERLESAIRLLEQRRESIRMEPRRAAVFDHARRVVDRIVMLKLASGDVAEALMYMDRARASLASVGGLQPEQAGEASAPAGEVVVEYALVADTLLVWTVSGARVDVFRTAVDTLRLVRAIEDVQAQLQQGATEAEVRPLLSMLFDSLVRPLQPRLGSAGTPLVLVADGALASVPFAALHDARTSRYLMEDHPMRFAVSLREARRGARAPAAPGVLLVADPAFDARDHPLLDRLRHAAAEVRRFANGYTGAAIMEGGAATRAGLVSGLGRAGIVHFAGHAVFDDQRPERSYLVLASQPGAPGRMTAEELSRLDLSHVRLVVLAACRTVRSAQNRAGGFTGLSGALLAAGAGGTLGSTWDVDDRLTAALMTEFHLRYQRSHDGPAALREAQLALRTSGDARLRSPAAWAGFRYAGR